jgi:hypothetical protein
MGVAHAALALAALWAILGAGWPIRRALALLLGIIAAWVAYEWIAYERTRAGIFPSILALAQAFWLVASLAVVRVAGYRVVREGPRPAS